jgi:hypothetical protein
MKRNILKKTIALALCVLMLFSLTACKSGVVKNVESMIAALGEITVDSQAAVEAAEAAYAALSDSDKTQVENAQTLTEARTALDKALKEARRKAILGTWDMVADATENMASEMAAQLEVDADELKQTIGSFTFKGTLDLKEDGTYRMTFDAESFGESMTNLFNNIKPIMRDVLAKKLSKQLLDKEDGTAEELDEILGSVLGMSLDALIDVSLSMINTEDFANSLSNTERTGKFIIDPDKDVLYFSESLDSEPDTANGDLFTLGDGIMEITDHFGVGFFDQFYPVKLTKVS